MEFFACHKFHVPELSRLSISRRRHGLQLSHPKGEAQQGEQDTRTGRPGSSLLSFASSSSLRPPWYNLFAPQKLLHVGVPTSIVITITGSSGSPLSHLRDAVLPGVLQPPGGHDGHARPHQLLHQLPPLLFHVHTVPGDDVQDAEQERQVSHSCDRQPDGSFKVNGGVNSLKAFCNNL